MTTRIELLKQAGFSEAEIGDWAVAERQRMHEAGFSDDEIDDEFGVTRPPRKVPAAFIERLKQGNALQRIAGAAGDYAERYFGDEPLGFSPKNQEFLHRLGVLGDLAIPAAKPVDAVLRAVPAGIAAVGAGIGQAAEEAQDAAFGPGPQAKGKAARDFAQLAELGALVSGTRGRTGPAGRSMPVRPPAPGVTIDPAMALPRAEDFRNAAAAISGSPASFRTEQKLLRLWTEHGIPPTEAVADAMRDRTIAEDLRSESGKLPEAYGGAGAPPAAPAAAPERSASSALAAEDGPAAHPEAPPPAPMTALSKDIHMFPPLQIPQRPFKFDYREVPSTDPTGKLLVDMEGRPLVANVVAGRRFAGKGDYPLTPEDVKAALDQLDIRQIEIPSIPNQKDSVVGLFTGYEERRRPVGDVYIKSSISPADKDLVRAHEIGHAIDYFANDLATKFTNQELDELRRVYKVLRGGPGKTLHPQPETYGYTGHDVAQELLAEGVRAYLTNPNFMKSMAPKSAARIRAAVNKNRYLKHVLQFNSLGAAGLAGAGAAGSPNEDDE